MSNQKWFAKVAIIVAVVVLIGIGYFVYNNINKNKDIVSLDKKNIDQKTAQTEEKQILTAEEMPEELTYEENLKAQGWKTYRNEEYGFEVMYPENIFQLDRKTSALSHFLNNFHKYSEKDGSDLGLAKDISIVFKKEGDKCNFLETNLDLRSIGTSFNFENIKGVKYETGAEGEGVVYFCVKDTNSQNIFLVEKWFLNESYSTRLLEQNDYINNKKQEEFFNQILSTFKFIK